MTETLLPIIPTSPTPRCSFSGNCMNPRCVDEISNEYNEFDVPCCGDAERSPSRLMHVVITLLPVSRCDNEIGLDSLYDQPMAILLEDFIETLAFDTSTPFRELIGEKQEHLVF
jgi:hypothetical protein